MFVCLLRELNAGVVVTGSASEASERKVLGVEGSGCGSLRALVPLNPKPKPLNPYEGP